MPGYVLVQQNSLSPPLPSGRGIKANTQRKGFADFLRDLEQEEFPYNEYSSLRIHGLEELLLQARPHMEEYARIIWNKLQSKANDFFVNGCGDVQIIFRGDLERGERLIDRHITESIPIYLIFGSPIPDEINGQKIYRVQFNLSGN